MTIFIYEHGDMFWLFFSLLLANMEPELRYIKCALNGTALRLQNNS